MKAREPKKEFEAKLNMRPPEDAPPGGEEKKGWFGKFGKKKPKLRRTAEEILKDRLAEAITVDPEQVALFKPVLKIPFDVWADGIKMDAMRLTDEQAQSLALPVAQLTNYYLPRISPIGYVWLSFGLTGFGIMQARLKMLADIRRDKKEKPKGAKVE